MMAERRGTRRAVGRAAPPHPLMAVPERRPTMTMAVVRRSTSCASHRQRLPCGRGRRAA